MIECDCCYDRFYNQGDCDEHMDEHGHHGCDTCNKQFFSRRAAVQHMHSLGHWEPEFDCETCIRAFKSQAAANQHMNAVGHWAPRYECQTCTKQFTSIAARDNHHDAADHWAHYCKDCQRSFASANNLKMHLNSKVHRGSNVDCPFCMRSYTTASGLSHHLETGSCPSAPSLNRESIYKIIRQRDTNGLITQKQLEWHSQDFLQTTATTAAWNGHSYECYLCHREFSQLQSLNQHLSSPAHKSLIYHCPNRHCGTEFKSLGSLFGHLESETCGFMRFNRVQQQVKNVITGTRMLTFG